MASGFGNRHLLPTPMCCVSILDRWRKITQRNVQIISGTSAETGSEHCCYNRRDNFDLRGKLENNVVIIKEWTLRYTLSGAIGYSF